MTQFPLFSPEAMSGKPDMDWRPLSPTEWPDFRNKTGIIGVDVESKDPNLIKQGPGFIRNDAFVCGVGLAAEDGKSVYIPLRHLEDNVEDVDAAIRYLKHQLGGSNEKCGANLMYELEALWSLGIDLKGPLADVQIAEPVLDEDREGGYSLDVLAKDYLGVGKEEDMLRDAAAAYGVDPKRDMDKIPARYVAQYCEADALLPIQIYRKQLTRLVEDDVFHIFELERKLQRVLFKMRLRGVRVDLDKIERVSKEAQKEEAQVLERIYQWSGLHINPASAKDVAGALKAVGLSVPLTAKGNESITADWLESQDNEYCRDIVEWRKATKMRKDFIDKLATDSYKGRIYSNWHQLREFNDQTGSTRGTRSGRIAASKFNLTQVPSRHPRWGKLIRSTFIADDGGLWVKDDYSQQEPRWTVHFAYLMGYPGAAEARQKYIDDPSTDYHQLVADMVQAKSGTDIGRRAAKDINLGSAYGMGKDKMAQQLGVDLSMAKVILDAYHTGVPYVKPLEKSMTEAAEQRGYIRTILGRKRRFKLWESARFGESGAPMASKEEAAKMWGSIRRAYCHKALNACIQGSAADQIKQALIDLDEAGLLPQIQVYDEINGSYASEAQAWQVKEIMENAIPSTVPFLAEPEVGRSWGETEELSRA